MAMSALISLPFEFYQMEQGVTYRNAVWVRAPKPWSIEAIDDPAHETHLRTLTGHSQPSYEGRTIIGGVTDLTTGSLGSSMQLNEEHTSELQSRGHLVCRLL